MPPSIPKNEVIINDEYAKALISRINSAEKSIYIFMYDWRWYKNDFSCDMSLINSALVRAVRRGVKIFALLNSSEIVETLNSLGIQAKQLNIKKLLHAKAVIIDEFVCIIGSHNFTENAMGLNLEISQITEDSYVAKKIINYFLTMNSV